MSVLSAYVRRYPLSSAVVEEVNAAPSATALITSATARCIAAAHRIAHDYPVGISVGAEEDAEAAIYVSNEGLTRLVADNPPVSDTWKDWGTELDTIVALDALGTLLVTALTELTEDDQLSSATLARLEAVPVDVHTSTSDEIVTDPPQA